MSMIKPRPFEVTLSVSRDALALDRADTPGEAMRRGPPPAPRPRPFEASAGSILDTLRDLGEQMKRWAHDDADAWGRALAGAVRAGLSAADYYLGRWELYQVDHHAPKGEARPFPGFPWAAPGGERFGFYVTLWTARGYPHSAQLPGVSWLRPTPHLMALGAEAQPVEPRELTRALVREIRFRYIDRLVFEGRRERDGWVVGSLAGVALERLGAAGLDLGA